MSTVSDGLYQYGGVPVASDLCGVGKVFWVRPGSGNDSNTGKKPSQAFATLAQALSKCTANAGDRVYLVAESNTAASTTDYQSATLDWNKDGVHLIGVGASPMIGSRARIAQLSTVKTVETLVKLSANNCLIANIEIYQGVTSSTATSPVALEVTGQRNKIVNCQISGNGDSAGSTDTAGARSLLLNGGAENEFINCYIGLDTVSRATQAAEIEHKSSAKRNILRDCIITGMSGASGFLFVKANAASSSVDRFELYKNCTFMNPVNSTATAMTAAIATHASLGGHIVIHNGMIVGATDVTAADSTNVKILGYSGAADASGEHKEMLLAKNIDVT